MAAAAADKVAVYLIRNDPKIVFPDYLGGSAQLALCPHPAGGVLRITPKHQLTGRVGAFRFKIIKVRLKNAVGVFMQRRGQYPDPGVFRRMGKIAVGGCIHQHLFVGGAEDLGQAVERRDNAGRYAKLLLGEAPIIVAFAPCGECVVISVVV